MKRFIKLATATSLLALATHAFADTTPAAGTTFSPAQKAQIEEVVHQYLVKKPEVIVEAIQLLQQKQYQEAEKTVKQTQKVAANFVAPLFHQNNDPVAGNPNGAVTVVEFFDYQCPHCIDMAPVIAGIIKSNSNVRIIFKDFPIRGPISEFAARAALAANKQGKYYDFNHALLTASQEPLTQDAIFQIAKNVGLDVDKLKKDMNDAAVAQQLKNNIKLAQDLKLFGTPALFIGKTNATASDNINYVPGQMDQTQLQAAIDKASK